jgi:hypothetical protein
VFYIVLTQNMYAKVDADDYAWLNQWKWFYHRGYACRNDLATQRQVYMHNAIAERHNLRFYPELDHKDRNGINNQKENFRSATRSEQNINQGKRTNVTSFKGVTAISKYKWRARIRHRNKLIHLGYYSTDLEAALAYDVEARQLFGEFAELNFPRVK